MATDVLDKLKGFPIKNADGTPFNDLILRNATYDSVVMALGDKVTGEVFYKDNTLAVSMHEYIEYDGVRYVLVNPPTIVREGMVSDNSELRGMTKYSFEFYHPMYMLGNFPFTDVAVSSDELRYLSENKSFAWIGYLKDFVDKLNKNLEGTEWKVLLGTNIPTEELTKLSEVLTFDKNTIADALKTGYETWGVPYVVGQFVNDDTDFANGKRFYVQYGLPTKQILVDGEKGGDVPFVFRFGQGVGLKNNSRTPRNNKIVTRLSGFGSEDNIPYGYPQIVWQGDPEAKTTQDGYPIYDGIVGGEYVKLIKHPFTRKNLMPSIYTETVNKKVNPYAAGYDPNIEIIDYYDADNTYPNPIKPKEPSFEIHEFEKIKPELGQISIVNAFPYNTITEKEDYYTLDKFLEKMMDYMATTEIPIERQVLRVVYDKVKNGESHEDGREDDIKYYFNYKIIVGKYYTNVSYESSNTNFTATILTGEEPVATWDDTMNFDGEYLQSYFKITLPVLSFDLYASAAITQEMKINMRSGACLGCTFPVEINWDDYKSNFWTIDGEFAPNGEQRDFDRYPDSRTTSITVIVKKELETFGTLMPNYYQQPKAGDKFVILGISLPLSYIHDAEHRLDVDMKQYMRDNNVYYFDYPLKFDEHFLVTNQNVLRQMKTNVVVNFEYANEMLALYIKQMSVKYDNRPLPTYNITLTDDVEIVLNQIGKVTDEVSQLRLLMGGGGAEGNRQYLRRDINDTAQGFIRFLKGIQVGNRFVTGLLGEGGVFRKEADGTTYLECDKLYVRMKAYFDTVEIRRFLHSGGNRIASAAGIKCSRVEYIDVNGEVTERAEDAVLFRCYFRANDEGREITNDFIEGDLAYCKETNATTSSLEMHGFWRAVVGRNEAGTLTDDGEAWIDLSARASETFTYTVVEKGEAVEKSKTISGYQAGSDVPMAQDDIIQLGHVYDRDRMGAIIEFVSGADSPSYQIFQGIDNYNLNNKNYIGIGYSSQTGRAYMNVYGDAYIGAMPDANGDAPTYIHYYQKEVFDDEGNVTLVPTMDIKANVIFQSPQGQDISIERWLEITLGDIQKQIDGVIETYYMEGVPTMQNRPVADWLEGFSEDQWDDILAKHIGDLYYDKTNQVGYRFLFDTDNNTYNWFEISDDAIVEALRLAAQAQDTADGKRRVFTSQPVPPYDKGDIWVNAIYPHGTTQEDENNVYYNDILRCEVSKTSADEFSIDDWRLASNYTDDSALNAFIERYEGDFAGLNASISDLDYIKNALGQAGEQSTEINGGLVLSTLIGLRNVEDEIWAGISGAYNPELSGGGIAAWFGGPMVDHEDEDSKGLENFAKIIFRFNGSGYVAGGNISWNESGQVSIKGQTIDATNLQIGGNNITSMFVTKEYFESLFELYDDKKKINTNGEIPEDKSKLNIKAMFGFWTEQYISALGKNSSGQEGGGGVSTLASLLDVELDATINNGDVLVWNGSKWVNGKGGGSGSVTSIGLTMPPGFKVTNTPITNSGTFKVEFDSGYSLVTPALSTKIGHGEDAYGWGNHAEKGYLKSNDLSNYVTLTENQRITGVKIFSNDTPFAVTSTNVVNNLNADKVDGYNADQLFRTFLEHNGSINFENNTYNGVFYIHPYDGANEGTLFNAYGSMLNISVGESSWQLGVAPNSEVWFRSRWWPNAPASAQNQYKDWTAWRQLAFIDSKVAAAALADAAKKLNSTVSLWGQSFNGTDNVSGSLSGVTSIYMSGTFDGAQGIELNHNSNSHANDHGGYIDFHLGGSQQDFTARIIQNSQGLNINDNHSDNAAENFVRTDVNAFVGQHLYANNSIFVGGQYLLMGWRDYHPSLMFEGYAENNNVIRASFGFHTANPNLNPNVNKNWYESDSIGWAEAPILQLSYNTLQTDRRVIVNGAKLQIGDGMIEWDSANNALKVSNSSGAAANFYALGGVSALGMSNGSNGSLQLNNLTLNSSLTTPQIIAPSSLTIINSANNRSVSFFTGTHSATSLPLVQFIDCEPYADNARINRLYLDNAYYIQCSGNTLQFYDGSRLRTVQLI